MRGQHRVPSLAHQAWCRILQNQRCIVPIIYLDVNHGSEINIAGWGEETEDRINNKHYVLLSQLHFMHVRTHNAHPD